MGASVAVGLELAEEIVTCRRVGNGVDNSVGSAELCDDLLRGGVAAVVAGFADEQDGTAVVIVSLVQHVGCVFDGIESSDASSTGLDGRDCGADLYGVGGEAA